MRAREDISATSAKDRLRDIQDEILKATASGEPLAVVTDLLCRRIEELGQDIVCSIVSIDQDGKVRPLASPSLPIDYARAIDGVPIGPGAGSCGAAAFHGEPVVVTDIANDPRWVRYRSLVLPHGLRASSSLPIKARDGRVVGALAFYYRSLRAPGEIEEMIVSVCAPLCAIALEQEAARAKIHQLAFYDPITGLANRVLFHQRAADILAAPASDDGLLAVHYIDLDGFKAVNDTLGHHIGDELLKEVGARLRGCVHEGDVVARLAGDEFAVLQRSARTKAEIRGFAAQVIAAIDQPFEFAGHAVAVRASVGFTIASGAAGDLATFLRQADLAVYQAKSEGGGTFCMFNPSMFKRAAARRVLEQDLRRSDLEREFEVVYQPIMSLKTGAVIGGEALIRWNHPARGLIPPADFLPIAERCGLIGRLGDWIIKTACRDAARWPASTMLAVNLSPVQIKRPGFALGVIRTLKETGVLPQRLEFEITERALFSDTNAARATLRQFKDVGIRVALDDFGSGFTALSHLRAVPIDTIKLDRSLVRDFGHADDATAIVGAMLRLARDLGMTTSAEGVETAEQSGLLAAAGCARAQGFYLGRPQRAADFEALLNATHLQCEALSG